MKKIIVLSVIVVLLVAACGNTSKKEATPEKPKSEQLKNIKKMTPEELGTEIGKIAAQAFNFLYDNLGNSPQITDNLKQKVKAEREKTFATFIPIINQYKTFSEDDQQKCNFNYALTMAENITDLGTKSAKFDAELENIAASNDEKFLMDVLSLYLIRTFLDDDAFSEEGAPDLSKHVGIR